MIRKTSGNSTEDGSGNQMTVLALPSPPCPLTGMLGGAGECPGLRTASRQPPLSPVGQEPQPPPASHSASATCQGVGGNTLAPFGFCPLAAGEKDAAVVSSYLAAMKFPSSSFSRLRKRKLAMRKHEKLKMCPAIHLVGIIKIKPATEPNRKHVFLPRTSCSSRVAGGLLLSYSPRSLGL